MDQKRRLEVNEYIDKRIMEVFTETWPICVNYHWTAIVCKEFIDEEILKDFTERDKYVRVIIKGKRKKIDSWYNTIVIPMDDNNMVKGRDFDGMIYYDFEWDGSGVPTTPEQETEIPPVLATETLEGSPNADASDPNTDPDAMDPSSPSYKPLLLEIEPVLVIGATVGGANARSDNNPIGGGVVVDPGAPNTPEGDVKLQDAKAERQALEDAVPPGGQISVEAAGPRELPHFDCEGLTGYNCCLVIKLKILDADKQDKAIQCQLTYSEGSNKEKFWLNARGKKVFIFANHNEFVSKIPEIVGDWPKGVGDFSGWLEDGGDPNRDSWIPEQGI